MDLQQLATELRNKVTGQQLTLDNSVIKQDSFAFVLSYFSNNVITLSGLSNPGAQIAVGGDNLTISALQSVFNINVSVTIILTKVDEATLLSDYATSFPGITFQNLVTWNIVPTTIFDPSILPALPFSEVGMTISSEQTAQSWKAASSGNKLTLIPAIGLNLTGIGFSIQRSPDPLSGGYDTVFSLTGNFELGRTKLAVTVLVPVSLSTPKGQWSLNLSSTSTLADGIADLSQVAFGNNLFAALPSGFQDALSFSLKQLLIVFSMDGATVKYLKIDIARPQDKPWTIVDGFTITGAGATFGITKQGKGYSLDTTVYGKFRIGKPDAPTKVQLAVTLRIPPGANDWLAKISGSIENNTLGDVFSSLPAQQGQSLPAFPIGLNVDEITLDYLNISFSPASRTLTYINFSVTSILELNIFDILKVQNPYVTLNVTNPTLTAQRSLFGKIGGTLEVAGLPLALLADKPGATSGWTFSASMRPGDSIDLLEMVQMFLKTLNISQLPDWLSNNGAKLEISDVLLSVYVPTSDATDQGKRYHVEGTVRWSINKNSFALKALAATVKLDYIDGKAAGTIAVKTDLMGLPFNVGYKFGSPDMEVYLEWLGIQADYKNNSVTNVDTITITFADMSLGEIVTHLIESFEPGFTLPAPWDGLNSINLSGLSFVYTRDGSDAAKNKIEIKYLKKISLAFIEIEQVTLTKDAGGVFLGFKGTFLGIPISSDSSNPDVQKLAGKGTDVRDMGSIPVPGAGTQIFDLDYLGLGQKVALYPFEDLKTVDQAISALKTVFKAPEKPKPGQPPILPIKIKPKDPVQSTLIFSEESNWMVAAKFTIIEAITLGVIFNDPNLYGLLIKLDGEKMKALNGLNFQILYKKVSDSVGVYQIQLKLPDAVRQLEFGAISVTLPIIGIDIYTNGSFKLDFGFPYNMDFSRSLTVQAFPFTGSGGFYIAYLSNVPSDNVPKTTVGTFNPVIEFGLGLQLGVGKSINKGILSAGFSITVVGIFEGVIAFYTPNLSTYPGKNETYYKVSATVGIVGRLYGEINFAIISASLDITVYAYVQMIVEAYRKIPVYLEAGVSVSLRVSINLGLFSIHVSLKFSTTISASFTIGSDSTAPWEYIPPAHGTLRVPQAAFAENRKAVCPSITVKWQPVSVADADKDQLKIYFFPQLTVAATTGTQTAAQFTNVLYIESPQDGGTTDTSLDKLVKGVLYWCISAVINKSQTSLEDLKKENVALDVLKQLFAYLSDMDTNPSPMPYADIEGFLKAYFTVDIMDPESVIAKNPGGKEITINASIFPLFPLLQVSWNLNGNSTTLSSYNVDDSYMEAVESELKKLQVNYRSKLEKEQDDQEQKGHGVNSFLKAEDNASKSMPEFVFQDYMLMVAKSALQDAIDEFGKYNYALAPKKDNSLNSIAAELNTLTYTCQDGTVITNGVTADALAVANSTVLFNEKLSLQIPGITYQVKYGDTLQSIADTYSIGVAQLDNDNNTSIQGLLAAGTKVQITGFDDYSVAPGQTIKQIADDMKAVNGTVNATTGQVLLAVAASKGLLSLAKLTLPDLVYMTTGADSFESVSTYYGIPIAAIAGNATNAQLGNIFNASAISVTHMQVLNVRSVVDASDTTDNIARIAGMVTRYFLHGMRLPVPGDLNLVSALYLLTGQQFALPALDIKDQLSIQLKKLGDTGEKCWLKLNDSCSSESLNIKITENTISRIQDLVTIQLDPDTTPLPPQPIALGKIANDTFTLKPGYAWQYPGKLTLPMGTPPSQLNTRPSIWGFSDALINQLTAPGTSGDLGLEVIKMVKDTGGGFTKQAVNYAFSTIIQVSIQEITGQVDDGGGKPDNVYEVIGANDVSIVLLERLIQHMNAHGGSDDFIQQIQVLYPPDNTGSTPNGLQSAANGDITLALVQANLSTETNPTGGLLANKAMVEEPRNTLNTFRQFINFLWQCSIVRTGGYFLYYKTGAGNALPGTLFSESKTGNISILITYKDAISVNFVNSVTIADTIDQSNATVYVKADKLTSLVATTPPGTAGFMLERKKPDKYIPVEPYPIPVTDASKTADKNYLNYQFNLVGYQLIENDIFRGVYSLLPVGATHDPAEDETKKLKALPEASMEDENWKYKSLIPLAKNVKDAQRIQPRKTSYPPATDDPYAGMGSSVNVRLNWQDMFGNTVNTPLSDGNHDVTLYSLYTDNIYTLAQWPSLSVCYSFPLAGSQPQLQLDFVIDPSRYTISSTVTKEEAVRNAGVDMMTYQRIYYQLIQNNIAVTLQTSINADDAQNKFVLDATILSDIAGDIWAYLNAVAADPSTAVPPKINPVSSSVNFNNAKTIFELTVNLSVSRTAHVDPAFAGVVAVNTAVNILKPVTNTPQPAADDGAGIYSLTGFAGQFEQTFKDKPETGNFLKVATGLDRKGSTSDDKKVWVVHFDVNGKNGIYYTIDNTKQEFYAPVPLANSLETYDKVSINGYKSGESYPYGSAQLKTFSDIDLDSWGRSCLEAVDLFLTAEYATPAFLIDNGITLQSILDAKEQIAEGIAGNVTNIIEPEKAKPKITDEPAPKLTATDPGRANAKEKLKQQLLIQLSNAYKINTIVQNRVAVTHGFSGSNTPDAKPPFVPQLYGDMSGVLSNTVRARSAVFGENEKTSEEYTLSTAKIPLGDGGSWLTYLFEAKEADKHSSFNFSNMSFKVSYIEHQIDKVENMGEYRASSWLTLIIPLVSPLPDLGPVEIPVVLRSYPTPPSLTTQQIDYAETGGPDQTTTLQDAVLWGYDFSYLPPSAGQDQIHAQIQFNYNNGSDTVRDFFKDEDGNYDSTLLPATLAQFVSVYPAIKQDFVSKLIKTPKDPVAVKAVQAFALLIKNIGTAWKKWKQIQDKFALAKQSLTNLLPTITYHYDVIEKPLVDGDIDSYLVINVNPDGNAPALTLQLPGYEEDKSNHTFYKVINGQNVYLKYKERNTVLSRNLSIGGMSILERQTAWAGVQLSRNEDLLKKEDGTYKTTNGLFIYETPLVKFYNELVPLLTCNEGIYIAQIDSPGKPVVLELAKHLNNLFRTLLQNSNNLNQTIKVECLYRYNLSGTDSFNQITIPILLATPFVFTLPADWEIGAGGSYCKDSTSFTCNLTQAILGWFGTYKPSFNNGSLTFVVDVYSMSNDKLPILKLSNLLLEVVYIKELQ